MIEHFFIRRPILQKESKRNHSLNEFGEIWLLIRYLDVGELANYSDLLFHFLFLKSKIQ